MKYRETDNTNIMKQLRNRPVIINDHSNDEHEVIGVVELCNGSLAPLYKNERFCLNGLYILESDNRVHLSRASVGGVFDLRNGETIDKAIENYNSRTIDSCRIAAHEIF